MSQLISPVTNIENLELNNNSSILNHFYKCDDSFNRLKCKICCVDVSTTKAGINNLLEHVDEHIAAKDFTINYKSNQIKSSSCNGSLDDKSKMDNSNYPAIQDNIRSNQIHKTDRTYERGELASPVSIVNNNKSIDANTHDHHLKIDSTSNKCPNSPLTIPATRTVTSTSSSKSATTRISSSQSSSVQRKTSDEVDRLVQTITTHNHPSNNNKQNSNTLPYMKSSGLMKANGTTKFMSQQTTSSYDFDSSIYNRDIGDLDRLTLTSSKSTPSSSSITKNFISRMNELSEPLKRKLKFWNKKSFQINQYDPSFKVIYLGNLGMQLCSKDESSLDKPIKTLWNNYVVNMKTEIVMRLTICNSGLKAITRQHGLTQYWSNRLVYCCCHKNHPRIFAWIYRHEGKKMRQELRCHAVFCPSAEKASKMVVMLNQRLALALQEFKREKKSNSQLVATTNNSSTLHKLPRTIPLRRQILAKGSKNFRPPLDRSKSAPKLTSIQEEDDVEDDEDSQDELEFEEYFDNKDDDDSDDYELDPSEWFGDNVRLHKDYQPHEVRSDDGRSISNINDRAYDYITNKFNSDQDDKQQIDRRSEVTREIDDKNDDSIDSRPNPDDSPRGGSRSSANTPNKSLSSLQNDREQHKDNDVQDEVREVVESHNHDIGLREDNLIKEEFQIRNLIINDDCPRRPSM